MVDMVEFDWRSSGVNIRVIFPMLIYRVKMVGLFGFATIGIATIIDLWELLDINRGLSWVFLHFLMFSVGFIVILLQDSCV